MNIHTYNNIQIYIIKLNENSIKIGHMHTCMYVYTHLIHPHV